MEIDILTLFPEMFTQALGQSVLGRAQEKKLVTIKTCNFRQFAENKHGHVDDYPYGGGAGMLLQVGPIHRALQMIEKRSENKPHVILLDPAGQPFNQAKAEALSQMPHLTFICGHYEGYDERIRNYVDEELSLGDFVLTGGELAAMVIIDTTVRLLDEAVGNPDSIKGDSFSMGLLEYPQYTRPREYAGMTVPDVLISGDHEKIADWKQKEALRRTFERRPDLLEKRELSAKEIKWLESLKAEAKKF